jgi:hypothetical protein
MTDHDVVRCYSVVYRDGRVGMFGATYESLCREGIQYLDDRGEKAGSEVSHIISIPFPSESKG